ncbi:MAG: hypothetical protein AAF400_00360 [Bacteroidota bacterium]
MAKQPGLGQEQAVQNTLSHARHVAKRSTDAVGSGLYRTSIKVSPTGRNLSFQARGGEQVRFQCHIGQWRAEVFSRIGALSRQSVLPVVCSQGEDVTSNLEVLSKYPWYSQRWIHVLGQNVCPTIGAVVYVGRIGLRGGGNSTSSDSSPFYSSTPDRFRSSAIDNRLGYFCHPFIVRAAADSDDASGSHTALPTSDSCISLDLGSSGIVQLYRDHSGNWRTYCQKHNLHGWLRAKKRIRLSINDLSVDRIAIHTCKYSCSPCVVVTTPKHVAKQPAVFDKNAKWEVVPHNEYLALQKVDKSVLWVPKGEGGFSAWDVFDSSIPKFRRQAINYNFRRECVFLGPLPVFWLPPSPDCSFSQYVRIADNSDSDSEDNTPDVDLNLDSGEAVRFYPWNREVWMAYLLDHDILAEAKAKSSIRLSANDLKVSKWSYHICRACRLYCAVVNTPEDEIKNARDQRRKQRQEARRRREEQRRLEEQRKQAVAHKALVQEIASQDTTESTTHFHQFLSQSPEEQRQQTRLQQTLQHLGEQATDQQALTSEAMMVASSADPDLADSQAHLSAEEDQDTPQPLAASHQGHRIPTDRQPLQTKPKQQRYP